jgi:hypothetical protein
MKTSVPKKSIFCHFRQKDYLQIQRGKLVNIYLLKTQCMFYTFTFILGRYIETKYSYYL